VPTFGLRHVPVVLHVVATAGKLAARWLALDAAKFLALRGAVIIADELRRAAETLDPYADDFIGNGSPLAAMMMALNLGAEGERMGVAFDPA